jgi:hypothetical protein
MTNGFQLKEPGLHLKAIMGELKKSANKRKVQNHTKNINTKKDVLY